MGRRKRAVDELTINHIVDEMTVDDLTVDELTLDDLTWYPLELLQLLEWFWILILLRGKWTVTIQVPQWYLSPKGTTNTRRKEGFAQSCFSNRCNLKLS